MGERAVGRHQVVRPPAGAQVEPDGGVLGDLDGDCDVDLEDFAVLQNRFTGPGVR